MAQRDERGEAGRVGQVEVGHDQGEFRARDQPQRLAHRVGARRRGVELARGDEASCDRVSNDGVVLHEQDAYDHAIFDREPGTER